MKANKFIIFLLFAVIGITQLVAKDQTHEKPDEYPEPDNHRIFIRNSGGGGTYTIPEVGEDNSSTLVNNAILSNAGISGFSYTDTKGKKSGYNSNVGLEYRFRDRLRLMYDQKTTNVLTTTTSLSRITGFSNGSEAGQYDWKESVSKMGLAYYHPITNRFNVGAMLRNYSIQQTYNLDSRGLVTFSGSFRSFPYFSDTNSTAKSSGLVPGIGLEFKIFRWLEFSYSMEKLNLKGTRSASNFSFGSSGAALVYSLDLTSANFNYAGSIQNAGFTFKYSSWFSTKVGYVTEKFNRDYSSSYSISGTSPNSATDILIGSVLTSSLIKSTSTFNYAYMQFEFSKGF